MTKDTELMELLSQQRKITEEVVQKVTKLNASDIVQENNYLKNELNLYEEKLKNATEQIDKLSEENKYLKNSLYEQIYNEKIAILNVVSKKVDVYFQVNINGEMNRLKAFEAESIRRIDEMMNALIRYRVDSQDEIFARLHELNDIRNRKISEAMTRLSRYSEETMKSRHEQYKRLHEEGLSETEFKGALKKNNIEALIGLNIINKIGILFLIIGVIAAAQFTYFRLPEIFKGIFMFLGGTILLCFGEVLNRRKANVFSLGLTSGGVAILYSSVAICYFGLDILSMYPALLICVFITILSFYLSQRYHSQTIATFSLIGGYLPILSISENSSLVYSAMVYFVILNLYSLITSFRKRWYTATFIGFAFNILATSYIMSLTLNSASAAHQIKSSDLITVIYITFAFINYTLIPIASAYFNKKKLLSYDVILLGINTFISAILLYVAFFRTGFQDYKGLLAVIFIITYYVLGKTVGKKLPEEHKIKDLFYLTSFAFVVLIIPLQFDIIWLSFGWLVEGVILVTYGVVKEEKTFTRYGYIVSSLCLAAFLLLDVFGRVIGYDTYFSYKYTSITIGFIMILGAYIYKKQLFSSGIKAFKYVTTINLWLYSIYMIANELVKLLDNLWSDTRYDYLYLARMLYIVIGFYLAYTIPRIKILADEGMKLISKSIYVLSFLYLIYLNNESYSVFTKEISIGESILSTILILAINLLSILAMMDFIKGLVLDKKLGVEWYPFLISVYFVIILTQNLIMKYNLEFTNFIISMIYIILAFSWILFGFMKRYTLIRRFGLGLSFVSIAKLCFLDLSFLEEGYRIISYFVFGIILISISFIYQYYSKRIEVNIKQE